ncbi:DUF6357 family protein [Streptomyces poriferorum]|nr:DUF6357 family protein [Streptomyces poriferorum]
MFRNDTQPEPPPRTTTRPLSFSDDKGNEQKWLPDGPRPALDAFREFMDQRRRDGSTSLSIEDEENEEALVLLFDGGAVCRVEFDGSVLRRTHPRDLRHRLEILTRVDGREPATDGEVTHLGFGNGDGDTVNAWLAADGRALVVTFDRTSVLNPLDHAGAHAASLYDGVPADLLALVRDVPETETTLNVPHPDGGTRVAATGVFHFSGPCAMADGMVTRLQEAGSDIEGTGVGRATAGRVPRDDGLRSCHGRGGSGVVECRGRRERFRRDCRVRTGAVRGPAPWTRGRWTASARSGPTPGTTTAGMCTTSSSTAAPLRRRARAGANSCY